MRALKCRTLGGAAKTNSYHRPKVKVQSAQYTVEAVFATIARLAVINEFSCRTICYSSLIDIVILEDYVH